MTTRNSQKSLMTRLKTLTRSRLSLNEKLELEVLLIFVIVFIGSKIMVYFEGRRLFDALYFSVITLAGVGYGDLVPKSDIGKVVAMFYALIGIPLFVFTTSLVVQSNRTTLSRLNKKKKDEPIETIKN